MWMGEWVDEWKSGRVGEWESGRVGEWESGRVDMSSKFRVSSSKFEVSSNSGAGALAPWMCENGEFPIYKYTNTPITK